MHDTVGEFKRQTTELNTGGVGKLAAYTENLNSCVLAGLNFKPCVEAKHSQHLSICLRVETEGTKIANDHPHMHKHQQSESSNAWLPQI